MNPSIKNWQNLKFGMFIHWGLYSILGEGEWARFNKPIDTDEYRKLTDRFTAEKFDAAQWAEIAKSAGMKYMVLTTRHHDGFSLWDSESSYESFTSMNSAAKRDFVAEYTAACREEGLAVGLYYSPMDWRFPGFFAPRLFHQNALQMKEQCHSQVRELLSKYGKIDILWYDGGSDYWLGHGMNIHNLKNPVSENYRENPQIPDFWEADKLDKMARGLQPGIVINNRAGTSAKRYGDFLTPECKVGEFNIETPWETCDLLADCWGWKPNTQIRSLRNIIQLLISVVTGGGNLLLNVGPRADGTIEEEQIKRLEQVGQWLKSYGESIYETSGGPIMNGDWGGTVWKDNKLYVHVIDWSMDEIKIPKLRGEILNIYSITAQNVSSREENGWIYITVPEINKQDIDTIIVIEYNKNINEVFKGFDPKQFEMARKELPDALIVDQL